MAKQTIKLKKYTDIINEYDAGEAITPGMLISVASDGDVDKHASAGGICEKMFALEDELQGRTIDTDYDSGDPVQCWNATPGEEVFAWLANGEDASIGDVLVSNGDGQLKVYTAAASAEVVVEEFPIAVALEAVDMSGSSGVDGTGRIKVRIL